MAANPPLKLQVAKVERCLIGYLCITDATGTTYSGDASGMSDSDRAYILEAAKNQNAVCLRGVTPDRTFKSAEKC